MDKAQLKTTLATLKENDEIKINFVGAELQALNGTYNVLEIKTGRGKGGSKLLTLQNPTTKEKLSTIQFRGEVSSLGTPTSEAILNITTVDGIMHGATTETMVAETIHPKNELKAKALRNGLDQFVGKEGIKLRIDAEDPTFQGEFTMKGCKRNPGRFGQLTLFLVNDKTNEEVALWTYKHSGIIKNVEILEEN